MMRRLLVLFALVAAAAGCDSPEGPPVVADNVVVTAPGAGMPMAAGYLEITNQSGSDIRITRVSSPDYATVEMHETIVEDGIARMRSIPVLEIADGETITFERGGRHLMLMQPAGTPGTITLNFYSDDVLLLTVSAEFTATMD
ncbi:MAG TPA: copper chaperone PCu(A)C [Woeseiaceae bacterium]|nr:copper chaperone PCu(A)C [Woeseiaceae bacterium]